MNPTDPEFVFAPVTVQEIVETEEHTEIVQRSSPVCDFCMDLRVRWAYPCEPFYVEELEFGSADEWLACERCASFIEASAFPDLLARSTISLYLRDEPVAEMERGVRLMLTCFLANRCGEREAFG